MKKNILILGGNSKKNISWIKKMKDIYSTSYSVNTISYNNWFNDERIDIGKEINKIKKTIKKKNIEIIIAKSIGILITTKIIRENIINPKFIIFMGYPQKFFSEENISILNEILELRNNRNLLFIQQTKDPQCFSEKLENITNNIIPIISINGEDHSYNRFIKIKRYIDEFIKLNSDSKFNIVNKSKIKEVVEYIDKNKKYYKYYNNWLSDSKNRILSFKYKNRKYIAKKVSNLKANIEIKNATILKKVFDNNKEYNYIINIPKYYPINQKSGYIISEYYGKDLNQYFYNMENTNNEYEKFVQYTYKLLEKNDFRYNGFLPRNTIINEKGIYLIDYEDLNIKNNIEVETTIKIGWSYFTKSEWVKKLKSNFSYNNKFASYFKSNNLDIYKNPYNLALVAESHSKNNAHYKMDDVINVFSKYISMEKEILLDIILYEVNKGNINKKYKDKLYSISQEIRILELVTSKKNVELIINKKIKDISTNIKEDCNEILKKYINKTIE